MGLVSADAAGTIRANDGRAMARYWEKYVYDAVGNFVHHAATVAPAPVLPAWTRSYAYLETSLIEDGSNGAPRKISNRLSSTTLNPAGNTMQPEPYQHDAHGNMPQHAAPAAHAMGLPGPTAGDCSADRSIDQT